VRHYGAPNAPTTQAGWYIGRTADKSMMTNGRHRPMAVTHPWRRNRQGMQWSALAGNRQHQSNNNSRCWFTSAVRVEASANYVIVPPLNSAQPLDGSPLTSSSANYRKAVQRVL